MEASAQHDSPAMRRIDEDAALRAIAEGTAAETGVPFFAALVRSLSGVLKTRGAWVTEYLPEARRLRALAFWLDDQWISDYEYAIDGTPCGTAIDCGRFVHYADRIVELFPGDNDLRRFAAVSYMGAPLKSQDGQVIGLLAVMDDDPMPGDARLVTLFRIFAARAAAELQRLRAEARVREREQQLDRLIHSALDGIIQLDQDLRVAMVNPAAEKALSCPANQMIGQDFARFLSPDARQSIRRLIDDIAQRPPGQQHLWIPSGLEVLCADGRPVPVEATLSRSDMQRRPFYTLILRSVRERVEAERQIHRLRAEAEFLREELRALRCDQLIGRSLAFVEMVREIEEVADTDATVLILGETGTGKELVARALHAASRRRDKPLIKVNCAAMPANLVESEFFGHEKGAFTGATAKREGRFALADGGTIFLDEVGELPLDLQVKLLRVLQEGEFEPVGSSQTRKVNVRVLAATNRDLRRASEEGTFRKDLYFRLNVFPIAVAPLRDRREDIGLLAEAFVERIARSVGRRIEPLTLDDIRRLRNYAWPGNVRELENVIERAVITSRDGRLNLDRALPEIGDQLASEASAASPVAAAKQEVSASPIRTAEQLRQLERDNLIQSLQAAQWRVAGPNGAARRLGMPPSTLTSRMKALGIRRPNQP